MKILKTGVAPPPKVYQGVCSTCGTEVEFDESEGTYRLDKTLIQVRCPICKQDHITSKVNDEIKGKLA